MPKHRILVADDEPGVRLGIRDFFDSKGFEVEEADSCAAAEAVFRDSRPDAAILDYQLPDGDGLELLRRLREIGPEVPIIILTAHGSIDLAVRAIKEGAEHFLTKPVELAALLVILNRVLDHQRTRNQNLAGKSRQERSAIEPFIGGSERIRQLAAEAERVVVSESPILIEGETGAGKGVLAGWLHRRSARAEEPFVDLNCAGLSRELLESELFGHQRGAFTGAVAAKQGLLEVAHRGTLFLDEIGDMDPQIQAKLLKVLEEKRFRRVGEVHDRHVDIRLIAATHYNLTERSTAGHFRRDLFFRISTLPLRVPSLRERLEDIPVLARRLLKRLAGDLGRGEVSIDASGEKALQQYPWPGNIRELRNTLERALLLSGGPLLTARDLRLESTAPPPVAAESSGLTLREIERQYIERVLQEENFKVESAARRLGIPRSSLYQKLKQLHIPTPGR